MPRQDIEFKTTDHVTLRGWMYKPADAPKKLPCLVISHGYTGLKEMFLDKVADRLVSALPIACLVYDQRGFGESDQKDGAPRSEIIAAHQASDKQDAITYAQSRPDIDATKIGLWGYSFSGGHALWLAAVDRRVKAVIALAPFTNGDVVSNNLRSDFIDSVAAMIQQDRLSRAAGEKPGKMPVAVENPLDMAALPQADSYAFFSPWAEKVGWKNELTIRTLEDTWAYFPSSRIHQIGPTPLLMQVPKKDFATITDTMLEAYSRAREPKELQLLPGGHYTMWDADVFEMMIGKQIEFLNKTLFE